MRAVDELPPQPPPKFEAPRSLLGPRPALLGRGPVRRLSSHLSPTLARTEGAPRDEKGSQLQPSALNPRAAQPRESEARAHVEEPPCCAKMCMCFLMLLLFAMVLASIGTGVWAIILWSDLSETNCKKLANVVGSLSLGRIQVRNLIAASPACARKRARRGRPQAQGRRSFLSCLALISMCVGFAIVTGNPPDAWGDGATSKERCDPDGDVFPQMTTPIHHGVHHRHGDGLFLLLRSLHGAVKPNGQPAIHPGGG